MKPLREWFFCAVLGAKFWVDVVEVNGCLFLAIWRPPKKLVRFSGDFLKIAIFRFVWRLWNENAETSEET